jgi:hypothetical protein
MKNKEKNKDNVDMTAKKAKQNENDENKDDKNEENNEDGENSMTESPFQLKQKVDETTTLLTQKSIGSTVNTSIKFDSLKEIPFEEVIKKLVDSYLSIKEIEPEKKIEDSKEYKNMLKSMYFYEEKPNDFSGIIKENDLSSIISYGISSLE